MTDNQKEKKAVKEFLKQQTIVDYLKSELQSQQDRLGSLFANLQKVRGISDDKV